MTGGVTAVVAAVTAQQARDDARRRARRRVGAARHLTTVRVAPVLAVHQVR